MQRRIIRNVWSYTKVGGIIMYSTCTVSMAENEENVSWIMRNFPVEPLPIRNGLPVPMQGESSVDRGQLQLLPGKYGTDGFFVAKFRRKA